MKNREAVFAVNRRRRWGSYRVVWVGAIFGTVLLVAVACLQYRWNMQIRRATEVQLGANLESVMVKWHLNLYREFSTICIALQVGPDSGAEDHWNDYLRRYEQWRTAASSADSVENLYSNPDVVSNIYIYETSRGSEDRLLVLDPDADRIESSGKPAELQNLLRRLRERSANLPTALRAWESDGLKTDLPAKHSSLPNSPRAKAMTGWQFDATIPAIVHPILHRNNNVARPDSPVDWLVVVLNRNTITHRIFPELAHLYFDDSQGLAYRLAVVSSGNETDLLYSSDPKFGIGDMGKADSVMNIFGPPPESTEGSFWQVVNHRESLHGDEWHRFSGPVWFPVFQQSAESRHWVLFLKARNGTMEASITNVWYANLFAGAVILLLLAGSVLLVLIATHRERTLVAMQLDFVTSISHELRTPLAGVLAAAQNIRDGYALNLHHYGNLISAQVHQLIDLVDQILLFAALKDRKKKYRLTAVRIDELLEGLEKTTFAVLTANGFKIDLHVDEELPRLLADKQGLLRCMQNLVENAAKYSGASKWIGVDCQLENPFRPEFGIKIAVADHGIGISAAEIDQIFDPFYRGAHPIEAQIHGSGLGLSVVKQIMSELRGRVSVTSRVGEGSTFTLHLKAAPVAHRPDINEQQEALTSL